MKKSRITSFFILCIFSAMLTGCNKEETQVAAVEVSVGEEETEEESMFGLTEGEQKMYAEYAAGVLMKYNAGSNMRVLEGQTLINQEAKEQAEKEKEERRQQLAAEYEANKNSGKTESQNSGGESTGSSGGAGISYISDMAAATGTDAFSISYEGYEVTDSYPSSGDDVFMAMDATQGKVLLVTKFNVTNISGQTENLNMFSKQGKFRLNLNGERYKSQYTLLLDDLSMYKGDIGAGETINTVLIFEIPEAAASNVNDMVLSITIGNEVSSMQLQGGTGVISTDISQESMEEVQEGEASAQESMEEIQEGEASTQESMDESSEYNDLAEEYMEALEAENAGIGYEGSNSDVSNDTSGNVTVVGSNQN